MAFKWLLGSMLQNGLVTVTVLQLGGFGSSSLQRDLPPSDSISSDPEENTGLVSDMQ